MLVCLLLAVLLLFHTNSFSFSFLPNSILIFTSKSQDSCLFKMPSAFFTPWPDPAAVNGAAAVSTSPGSSPKHSPSMTPVGSDLRTLWPFQNIKPKWKGAPAFQARTPKGINITLHRFIAKLKGGSCWRQNTRGIFLHVFFSWWKLEMELACNKCW